MMSTGTGSTSRSRRLPTIIAGALLAVACSAPPDPPAPPVPSAPQRNETAAACDIDDTTMTAMMTADNWAPVTGGKWRFPGTEAILAEAGTERPGPRRPFEYAVFSAGPEFGSVQIEGEVQLDSTLDDKAPDAIIVFGYRSDTEFYYVHLSTANTSYAHNGIFIVNNTDRRRI